MAPVSEYQFHQTKGRPAKHELANLGFGFWLVGWFMVWFCVLIPADWQSAYPQFLRNYASQNPQAFPI